MKETPTSAVSRDDSPAVKLFRPVTPRKLIEYEHLPGSVGDERWRQEAVESTVRLSDNGRGGRSCRVRAAGAYFWKACADDEPGLLPAPGGWLAKVRIFFPLPVHAGLDELPCID